MHVVGLALLALEAEVVDFARLGDDAVQGARQYSGGRLLVRMIWLHLDDVAVLGEAERIPGRRYAVGILGKYAELLLVGCRQPDLLLELPGRIAEKADFHFFAKLAA